MSSGYGYSFPALRGTQAGHEYYVAMCPLSVLPKLFVFDEAGIPAELRAQRQLNHARIPEITRYILENRGDYAFSAITASLDSEVRFEAMPESEGGSSIGRLYIPMTAKFIINDGQHRRAAIEKALETQPELGSETIAVVFYTDVGLKRTQQLFADLNKHAIRPTKSLGILYDYRDPLARLACDLSVKVQFFKGMVETEKTTISNRSIKLFTLNGIYEATGALLGKHKESSITETEAKLAYQFWVTLGRAMPEWQLAAERKVSSAELRQQFVHVHSVALHAIGIAGLSLIKQRPKDWQTHLLKLRLVDWHRTSEVWEGKAILNGQMSKARQNVHLTAIYLMEFLGLKVDKPSL